MRWSSLVVFLAVGCALNHRSARDNDEHAAEAALGPPPEVEAAPAPASRRDIGAFEDLTVEVDGYFAGFGSKRVHVQIDRPMIKPGEALWIKTWNVATRGLRGDNGRAITYELVDPRGVVVETKRVQQRNGTATNDFVLAADAPGGKWIVRATDETGASDERPFVVSSYATPRIRKQLEFVREAYGPGDRVEALVELERSAGGPLAETEVQVLLQVAGQTVLDETAVTDATGAVLVGADLPEALESSDGLLTVLVAEGGVTESISRSVPIVLADLQLAFFPEGGDLVQDLPGRVYFEATNAHGEPADVAGVVEDDRGRQVAAFRSVHDGLGRLAFAPEAGRQYTARITAPVGIETRFALPEAKATGCTLRSYDDVRSVHAEVRVGVRCSERREVAVAGMLREKALDAAVVVAGPGEDAAVYLSTEAAAAEQGAVTVTVFDADRVPLAERLVYRNHGKNLQIEVTPDRERYGPRDPVVLEVQTRDPEGSPIAAEVALSVVDDAVIGLADDEEGHMLSRLYLEPDLVDSPKDPAFYFDPDEALAATAVDLVLGTKGHRRFEWRQVFDPAIGESIPGSGATVWLDASVAPDDGGIGIDGVAAVDSEDERAAPQQRGREERRRLVKALKGKDKAKEATEDVAAPVEIATAAASAPEPMPELAFDLPPAPAAAPMDDALLPAGGAMPVEAKLPEGAVALGRPSARPRPGATRGSPGASPRWPRTGPWGASSRGRRWTRRCCRPSATLATSAISVTSTGTWGGGTRRRGRRCGCSRRPTTARALPGPARTSATPSTGPPTSAPTPRGAPRSASTCRTPSPPSASPPRGSARAPRGTRRSPSTPSSPSPSPPGCPPPSPRAIASTSR